MPNTPSLHISHTINQPKATCELFIFQSGALLGRLNFDKARWQQDEQQTQLASLTQLCQTPKLQLVMLFDAKQASQALLDLQFLLLQQVYRPLMRSKGAQVWVVWQQSHEPIWREGALALCQIMALELAAKQVAVNFLCQTEAITLNQLTPLLAWAGAHYCTAQALTLPSSHAMA